MEQELRTLLRYLSSRMVSVSLMLLSGYFSVQCFVYHYCAFLCSFGHCIACLSLIFGFGLLFWYLQTFLDMELIYSISINVHTLNMVKYCLSSSTIYELQNSSCSFCSRASKSYQSVRHSKVRSNLSQKYQSTCSRFKQHVSNQSSITQIMLVSFNNNTTDVTSGAGELLLCSPRFNSNTTDVTSGVGALLLCSPRFNSNTTDVTSGVGALLLCSPRFNSNTTDVTSGVGALLLCSPWFNSNTTDVTSGVGALLLCSPWFNSNTTDVTSGVGALLLCSPWFNSNMTDVTSGAGALLCSPQVSSGVRFDQCVFCVVLVVFLSLIPSDYPFRIGMLSYAGACSFYSDIPQCPCLLNIKALCQGFLRNRLI